MNVGQQIKDLYPIGIGLRLGAIYSSIIYVDFDAFVLNQI